MAKTGIILGATGLVGRFVAEHFLRGGHDVIAMGRKPLSEGFFSSPVDWVPGDLDPDNDWTASFASADHFIHCAFNHVPGKYRGGEGHEPKEFRRLNIEGSLSLFSAAKQAGVKRAVFLSSRAVYDGIAAGTRLVESMPAAPTSLYGQVKRDVELGLTSLADAQFLPMSVRATGVYGPGRNHKWEDLFAAFMRREAIPSRVGTELHGDDLAAAIAVLLAGDEAPLRAFEPAPVFNASDIVLDRRELLHSYAARNAIEGLLPEWADSSTLNIMECGRLRSLGWTPRGKLDLTGF